MEETGTMMLQDIWPHRLRNQFTDKTDPTPDSPVFCFRKADLLTASSRDDAMEEEIDQSGEHGKISMPEAGTAGSEEKDFYRMRGRYLKLPTVKQLGQDREYIFLFSMDGGAFFLLSGDIADEEIPEGSAEPAAHPQCTRIQSARYAAPSAAGRFIPASFPQLLWAS